MKTKVLLVSGSVSEDSHTVALVRALQEKLTAFGAETTVWNLREKPLPIADPSYHRDPSVYPDAAVREFVSEVKSAQAFALASPLYHGSFSGVLKNALDHLWYDAFRNKPVALLSHGSTERRCSQPCVALQPVVTTMYGYGAQTMVATTKSDFTMADGRLQLTSPDVRERVERQAKELLQLSAMLRGQDIVKED